MEARDLPILVHDLVTQLKRAIADGYPMAEVWYWNPEHMDIFSVNGLDILDGKVILYCGRKGPQSGDPGEKGAVVV